MSASQPTISEIKTMLVTLRVAELQELLVQANMTRCGRKQQLIDRLSNYLKDTPAPELIEAIKLKFEARVRNRSAPRRFRGNPTPPPSPSPSPSPPPPPPPPSSPASSPAKKAKGSETSYVPIDVRFRSLPFYHQCDVIIRPSLLRGSRLHDGYGYSMRCEFSLTRNQIEQIVAGKGVDVISASAVTTYKTKLILRFCLYESSCEQSDKIPSVDSILMNHRQLPVPFNLSYEQDSNKLLANPYYYPFDLTSNCELREGRKNVLIIYWNDDYQGEPYAFQVSLVKAVAVSDLIAQLRSKVRNSDYTREMIKDKLKNSSESEVALMSLRVSLLCPLGRMKMKLPCRGTDCKHLQCFDGELYVQMNEKKSSWLCPVCDHFVLFDNLTVDGYFLEILASNPSGLDIVFSQDGSWSVFKENRTEITLSSPHVESNIGKRGSVPSTPPASKARVPVVVDLTLDSDEEDQQPPAPSAQNSQSSCALSSFSPPPPLRGPASPVPSQPPPLQFVAPPPPPFPGACAFGQDNQTPPRRKGSAKITLGGEWIKIKYID
ncbi:E3 SUMO-protein ligase PIAS3-like isoform X2 [Oscarella lobularis]|uniref:E3 SUMO-protein ligase PIAS3-like isoform X2 n=1 Tax=Oscarella lobularis TaxID=121494 RepID=UPI003313F389